MATYYTDVSKKSSNPAMQYRGVMEITSSSPSPDTIKISWEIKGQMKEASLYGLKVSISGADSGSDSGVITSSSTSWKTVCSKSGSYTLSRGRSSKESTLKVTVKGVSYNGYGAAWGDGKSKSHTISIAAKPSYTVSYNANGGSGAPSSQTKWYGETLTLSSTVPTKTGYTFKGWATSSSATSVTYAKGSSYTSNSAATLYAVWSANTYTISYNANGGSGAPASQTKKYDTTLTLSSTKPTRSGYTFLGWSTSSTATSATYSAGGSYTANAAATLYAVWSTSTCIISYNANGGSGAPASQTKTSGVALTLSSTVPTRSGYTFLGWSTSSTATSATYSAGGTFPANINTSTTLYAVWQGVTYTLTFNLNGGSGSFPSVQKKSGVTYTLPTTIPTKSGQEFSGWKDSDGVMYSAGDSYTKNASTTFTAQWAGSGYAPQISNFNVYRKASSSSETDDEGTSFAVSFQWVPARTSAFSEYTGTHTLVIKNGSTQVASISLSVPSGHVIGQSISYPDSAHTSTKYSGVAANTQYTISVTLTGNNLSVTQSQILPKAQFVIDAYTSSSGNISVGIGRAADESKTGLQVSGDIYANTTKVSLEGHTHSYVPTSRTVNGKALSSNITLNASDLSDMKAYVTYTSLTGRTSNSWDYIKYSDGTMIAYKNVSTSYSFGTSYGSYIHCASGSDGGWLLPSGFIAAPSVQATCQNGNFVFPIVKGVTATNFGLNMVRLTNSSDPTMTVEIGLIAIGRWK